MNEDEARRLDLDSLRRHIEAVRRWHDNALGKQTPGASFVIPIAKAELARLEPILLEKELTT